MLSIVKKISRSVIAAHVLVSTTNALLGSYDGQIGDDIFTNGVIAWEFEDVALTAHGLPIFSRS